jgi:hypothetical protein
VVKMATLSGRQAISGTDPPSGTGGGDVEAEKVFHSYQVGSCDARSQTVFMSCLFGGQRLIDLYCVTLYLDKMPPSQRVSEIEQLGTFVVD